MPPPPPPPLGDRRCRRRRRRLSPHSQRRSPPPCARLASPSRRGRRRERTDRASDQSSGCAAAPRRRSRAPSLEGGRRAAGGGWRRSPQHPRPRRRPAEVTCGRGGPPAPAPLRPGAGGLEVPSGSLEGLPLRHSLLPRAVSEKQMLQQSVGFRGASTSRLQPAYFCHKLSLRNPSDLSSSWKSITANHAATALLP